MPTYNLTFSGSGFFVKHARTMDAHLLSKFSNVPVSMSKITKTTLAPQGNAPSLYNEKGNFDREVTVNKGPSSDTGIRTDSFSLPRIPSILQGFTEDRDGFHFSPTLQYMPSH